MIDNVNRLKSELDEAVKLALAEWTLSDSRSISLPMISLERYSEIMKELGWTENDDMYDTNGWEPDFWMYFEKDSSRICLSGSLRYSNFSMSKDMI